MHTRVNSSRTCSSSNSNSSSTNCCSNNNRTNTTSLVWRPTSALLSSPLLPSHRSRLCSLASTRLHQYTRVLRIHPPPFHLPHHPRRTTAPDILLVLAATVARQAAVGTRAHPRHLYWGSKAALPRSSSGRGRGNATEREKGNSSSRCGSSNRRLCTLLWRVRHC